jgi:hypothetical protein
MCNEENDRDAEKGRLSISGREEERIWPGYPQKSVEWVVHLHSFVLSIAL